MMLRVRSTIALIAAAIAAFSGAALAGPGDLLVSPVRVVFEGRDRVAEVTLVNKGEGDATYRVSFENRRMNEDGSFLPITEAAEGERFAEDLVRYAPRRVSLSPNQPQTLRLMLRKPAELEEGEYRSHLHLAAMPDDAGSASIEAAAGDADGISIQLTPVYGVTIPVIVRHGALNAEAKISNLDYEVGSNRTGSFKFTLERGGQKSLYGDLQVADANTGEVLAEKRGIAVYTPNAHRLVEFDLSDFQTQAVRGKVVELRFADRTSGDGVLTSVTAGPLN